MTPLDRFSLEMHEGPWQTWPLQSRLLENGRATSVCISGYFLRHQFETPDGYLFIADYDCPFEEVQKFTLVSRDYAVLATASLGGGYSSFWIDRLDWLDDRHLQITDRDEMWMLTLRPWGIPYLYPRLMLQKIGVQDDRTAPPLLEMRGDE